MGPAVIDRRPRNQNLPLRQRQLQRYNPCTPSVVVRWA
jgi:hypothetical protein